MSSTALNSIEIVLPEIESTIHQAELSLTRFQENRDSIEDLQNCIDCLNQLRGIFTVVEVQGCVLLCQESVSLANEVPVGANDDKNGLLANLSNAIFILRRYSEYFHHQKNDHPQLLLPIINELRKARKAKTYPESHFFELELTSNFDIAAQIGIAPDSKLSDFEHHAKRFRHMFQVALLDILKDKNPTISLRLINRATEGCAKLFSGEPLSQFWALVAIVTDVMRQNNMGFSESRKRMFMKVEKYLREMVMVGKVVGTKTAPDSLTKDLMYLLALSGDQSEQVKTILAAFGVEDIDFNEAILAKESKRLFGPGIDVLRSLSKAIHDEMIQLKDKLDIFERGTDPTDEDLDFIMDSLQRLSGTLSMLDLSKVSALADVQVEKVKSWKASGNSIPEDDLLTVADGILTIENAVNSFEETGIQPDIDPETLSGQKHGNAYLSQAKSLVIEESCSGLALAKRSISAFIESQGDKLHLANVAQVMDGIRGAMIILDANEVSGLIAGCAKCINAELYENQNQPEERILETLADAISSLEYYIESMNFKDAPNDQLLKLSKDSLESIGYL